MEKGYKMGSWTEEIINNCILSCVVLMLMGVQK